MGFAYSAKVVVLRGSIIRGRSVAPPYSKWRLHIVTEMELKSEYEGVVR